MKLFTAKKALSYCDPIIYGPCCFETTDFNEWCDRKGNQQIWIKHARSRAVICLFGKPLYTKSMQDVNIYWYKFWDLPPLHLPPSITKEPGQYMLRLYRLQKSESPSPPSK